MADFPAFVPTTTTKGDTVARSATALSRLAVGSDTQVLTADSTQALGIKWATPAATSPLTTKGDLYGYAAANARVPVGANGTVLIADSSNANGVSYQGSLIHISRIVTAASQATVDFTSIPANYFDLVVRFQARSNLAASTEDIMCKFNNDGTSSNYSASSYMVQGGTGTQGATALGTRCGLAPGTSTAANYASCGTVVFHNYTGTTFYKSLSSTGNFMQNTANVDTVMAMSATWISTAAITRLTFSVATSFLNGSVFTLYGVGH